MKTLKSSVSLFAILLSIFLSSSVFAAESNTPKATPQKLLKMRVLSLLEKPELADHGITEETVTIEFTINENNRIELSTINSKTPYLKTYLKRCLQKEKAFIEGLELNTTHKLTLIFRLE